MRTMNTSEMNNANVGAAAAIEVSKYYLVKNEYCNKLIMMFDEAKKKFHEIATVEIPNPDNPQVMVPFNIAAEAAEIIDKVFVPIADLYTDENANFDKAYSTAQTESDIHVLIASYAQFLGMLVDSKVKLYQQSTQLLGTRQSALQVQFTQIKTNILSDLASSCIMVINTIAENLDHHCRKNDIKTEEQFYPKEKELYLFLDVETVGFDGGVFAYGAVIADALGNTIKEVCAWIDPNVVSGETLAQVWVKHEIVPKLEADENAIKLIHCTPDEFKYNTLEQHFMDNVMNKYPHLRVVADCPYPVETRFFTDLRLFPYPIIDVASMLLLIGKDPVASYERLEDEKLLHHPLHDARQTKRMFFDIVNGRGKQLKYRYDNETSNDVEEPDWINDTICDDPDPTEALV